MLLDIAMMRRPWVVGVEVPGEGIGEGTGPRSAVVSASDCGSEGSNPISHVGFFGPGRLLPRAGGGGGGGGSIQDIFFLKKKKKGGFYFRAFSINAFFFLLLLIAFI